MKHFYFLGIFSLYLLCSCQSLVGMDKLEKFEKLIPVMEKFMESQSNPMEHVVQIPGTNGTSADVQKIFDLLMRDHSLQEEWLKTVSSLSKEDREKFSAIQNNKFQLMQLLFNLKNSDPNHTALAEKIDAIHGNQSNIWRSRIDTLTTQFGFLLKLAIMVLVIYQVAKGQTPQIP